VLKTQANASGDCRARLFPSCLAGYPPSGRTGCPAPYNNTTAIQFQGCLRCSIAFTLHTRLPRALDLADKSAKKVKIFAWLYFKDRLSTKANLFYKNVKEDAICSHCEHPIEDRHHTFFGCPLSRDTWNTIGLGLLSTMDDTDVWTLPTAVQQDPATWPSILLTILWCLWEARNGTIFRSDNARSDWPYLR
jgi:hypothetical protein